MLDQPDTAETVTQGEEPGTARDANSRATSLARGLVWLVLPVSILIGDILIRFDGGVLTQLGRANAINLPSSFLLSTVLWFALSVIVSQLPEDRRKYAAVLLGGVGATAVVAVWQYNLVILHDPNPGVLVYSAHEPANAKKLAESGLTVGFFVSVLAASAIATAALLWTRLQLSAMLRRVIYFVPAIYVMAAFGWHDPLPDHEAPYVSDVYFGVLIGTAVKRATQYGGSSFLTAAERRDVTVRQTGEELPHVLLFVAESLRRHQMSVHGYERDTTPHLKRWAQARGDGFVDFGSAWTTSAMTPLAVGSFLTGLYPGRDKAEFHSYPVLWQYAHALKGSSYVYSTQMWTWSNLSTFFLADHPPQHWATADEMGAPIVNDTGVDDRVSARRFAAGLANQPPNTAPSLMLYQSNSTHFPLLMHESPQYDLNDPVDRYDAAVRVTDEAFSIVVAALEAQGLADDTIIIFVADHGEFEWSVDESAVEGREIATDLQNGERIESCHPVLAHIPMWMYVPPKWQAKLGPRFATLRENASRTVSLVDVFPTVLDLWGQQKPSDIDGLSLLQPIPQDRVAVCFTASPWLRWLSTGYALIDQQHFTYRREDFLHVQVFDVRDEEARVHQLRGRSATDADIRRVRAQIAGWPILERFETFVTEASGRPLPDQ